MKEDICPVCRKFFYGDNCEHGWGDVEKLESKKALQKEFNKHMQKFLKLKDCKGGE